MSDLARSLVDAAARSLANEDAVRAEGFGLGPSDRYWDRLSEAEQAEYRTSAHFAVAAVLETLAAHCDPVATGDGTSQALLSNTELRRLAAEAKEQAS